MTAIDTVMDALVANTINAVVTKNYNGYGPANASGQLAASISWEQENETTYNVIAVGPAAKYVNTLRYGRKPGAGVPFAAIKKWITDKGLSAGKNERQLSAMAFAIKKSIEKNGNVVYKNGLAPSTIWDDVVQDTDLEQLAEAIGQLVTADIK